MVNRLFDATLEIGGAFATKQLGFEPTLQQQRLGLNQQISTTPATASESAWNSQTALILGGAVFVVFFIVMASK